MKFSSISRIVLRPISHFLSSSRIYEAPWTRLTPPPPLNSANQCNVGPVSRMHGGAFVPPWKESVTSYATVSWRSQTTFQSLGRAIVLAKRYPFNSLFSGLARITGRCFRGKIRTSSRINALYFFSFYRRCSQGERSQTLYERSTFKWTFLWRAFCQSFRMCTLLTLTQASWKATIPSTIETFSTTCI